MSKNERIEGFLDDARTSLSKPEKNPALASAMDGLSYGTKKRAALRALHASATKAYQTQIREYAEKYDATNHLHEQRAQVEAMLNQHRDFADIAVDDDTESRSALQLGGSLPRTYAGLIQMGLNFYSHIQRTPDLQAALAPFSLTPEVVTASKEKVETLAALYDDREMEADEAAQATEDRDNLIAELRGRMRHFHIVMEHAERSLKTTPSSE